MTDSSEKVNVSTVEAAASMIKLRSGMDVNPDDIYHVRSAQSLMTAIKKTHVPDHSVLNACYRELVRMKGVASDEEALELYHSLKKT